MTGPFEKLPIFEDFDGAASFAEMADILIKAPPAVLGRYDMTLRNRLRNRGFLGGIGYLEIVRTSLNAVRNEHGTQSDKTRVLLEASAQTLREEAHARDGAARSSAAPEDEGGKAVAG